MVHVVTGHDWKFIMSRLSYAKGLQARTIFWEEIKGIACESPTVDTNSLETVIR